MSSRNIRRVLGGNVLPPPEEDSDYEPLYTKNSSKNRYVELGALSVSDSEPDKETSNKDSEEESLKPVQNNKTKSKRKNKSKNKKQKKHHVGTSFQMDEIDQSLKEVNALLGSPPPAPEVKVAPISVEDTLFAINYKHLNPAYELRRLLGPNQEEEAKRRRNRLPNYLLKRGMIVPIDPKFRKNGLSMTMYKAPQDDGCSYFTIDHDPTYQKNHKMFLKVVIAAKDDFPDLNIHEEILEDMHLEEILQVTEILFAMEKYGQAKKYIEKIIAYLHFISHPLFRISDRNVRLEYAVLENRTYHVAMLKFIYVLTNSACHRTALELLKVLMNLDSSDPLALILLVDMLALRAKEHQWLTEVVEYWKGTRDANFLFNLLYSNALAHYHVVKKNKGDMAVADSVLQYAMKRFPLVVPELFKATNNKNQVIGNSEMFQDKYAMPMSLRNLWNDLLKFYTLFTASKWREPGVWAWFTRNALCVAEQYDTSPEVQRYVKMFSSQRATFLRCMPQQVVRHFQVIKFMNIFVFDEIIFSPRAGVASYNPEPWPMHECNRYGYKFLKDMARDDPRHGVFSGFIRSIVPTYVVMQEQGNWGQGPALGLPRNPENEGEESMATLLHDVRELINAGLFDFDQHQPQPANIRWDLVFPDD